MIKLKDLLKEAPYKQIGTNKNDGYILHGKDIPIEEAKGKWAVINANDVLNIFPEKVVDSQKEAEKIAKQMKQKDRYGRYQAVSVKRWNQAGKGKKIKEGKLSEMKVNKGKVDKTYKSVLNHMRKVIKKLNDDEMYEVTTQLKKWFNKNIY